MTNNTTSCLKRGGSWLFDPQYARVAFCNYRTPDFHNFILGVRLVEEIEDTK